MIFLILNQQIINGGTIEDELQIAVKSSGWNWLRQYNTQHRIIMYKYWNISLTLISFHYVIFKIMIGYLWTFFKGIFHCLLTWWWKNLKKRYRLKKNPFKNLFSSVVIYLFPLPASFSLIIRKKTSKQKLCWKAFIKQLRWIFELFVEWNFKIKLEEPIFDESQIIIIS